MDPLVSQTDEPCGNEATLLIGEKVSGMGCA